MNRSFLIDCISTLCNHFYNKLIRNIILYKIYIYVKRKILSSKCLIFNKQRCLLNIFRLYENLTYNRAINIIGGEVFKNKLDFLSYLICLLLESFKVRWSDYFGFLAVIRCLNNLKIIWLNCIDAKILIRWSHNNVNG